MERPLKQRLIGAAVLVAVVVLVLPELLAGRREVVTLEPTRDDSGVPLRAHEFTLGDGPTAEEQAVANDELQPDPETPPAGVPAGPGSDAVDAPAPVAMAPAAAPVVAPAAAPTAVPAGVPPAAAVPPAPAPVPVAAPKPAPKPATKPAPAAVPPQVAPAKSVPANPPPAKPPVVLSGWVVQIGSFGTRQKADELVAKLQGKGFRAFTLPYNSGGRTLHRVRVGPEQSRKTADEIAKRLEAEGYPSHVVPQE